MKRTIAIFILVMLAFSCKDDDSGPGYNFKDQDAMGEIADVEWMYEDGYAEIIEGTVRVTLIREQNGETGCDIFLPEDDQVFFRVPLEDGLYKLSLGGGDPRTATLFDDEETFNYLAVEGAIEIISVSDTEVKGRIDATADQGENFVNGNFRVPICK
jgi:hypothetical protein